MYICNIKTFNSEQCYSSSNRERNPSGVLVKLTIWILEEGREKRELDIINPTRSLQGLTEDQKMQTLYMPLMIFVCGTVQKRKPHIC